MKIETRPAKVLVYQSIGFLAIIAVCMLDELVGLSSLILGNQPYISDFRETILKTLLIFGVWLIVAGSTRRVLERMQYLEAFMKVCAWCRRVGHNGKWLKMERYFAEGFQIQTTHGMCPDCLKRIQEETAEFKRKETAASSTSNSDGQTSLSN